MDALALFACLMPIWVVCWMQLCSLHRLEEKLREVRKEVGRIRDEAKSCEPNVFAEDGGGEPGDNRQ